MAPTLRPYQADAISAVRARFAAGDRSTLILLPTGCGKTVVFAEVSRLAVDKGRRVLVLAHRTELLEQAVAKLSAVGVDAAIEQGERRAGDAAVVVASVQTLRGRRLAAWQRDAFGMIVIDEAHHATARTYRAVLDHFETARVLGVTATGDRADGQGLGEVFASVAYEYKLRAAIKDGWLVPIRAKRVRVEVDLDDVGTRCGDLHVGELGEVMNAAAAIDGVIEPLLDLAGDRPTILFAVDVAHAHALAAALNDRRPGCALAVSGESSGHERRQAAADLADRRVQFVANAQLWTEGFDLPAVSCIALARPTKSRALFVQMVGRGTRLAPDKHDVLVLDFTGNTYRHRLVTAFDILADRELDDDELAAAEALMERGGEIDMMATDVKELAAAARRAAVIGWIAEEVGGLLDLEPVAQRPDWARTPATANQRRALEAAGLVVPADATMADASAILDGLAKRRAAGLCTVRQARWLSRRGVDASAMKFEQAAAAIDVLVGRYRAAS